MVYEALSKGVSLPDNQLYDDMLDRYPYFQKLAAERKTAISKFAKLAKLGGAELPETNIQGFQMVKRHKFTPKYKFEQRFADKLKAKDA